MLALFDRWQLVNFWPLSLKKLYSYINLREFNAINEKQH
ncbi:hypothetical protein HMPREF1144_5928 [Klebsiella sp. OBRC7]|nr:hypothetical protein CSC12_0471 [Klebsiella michiganensis]EJU29449.1 hypothetical protein HMPREF1144_5928 [Klebsiella sp. OBRC7]EUB40348.1 hypothetical protein HMPREF1502_5770 [Klebsiella sp. AS10]